MNPLDREKLRASFDRVARDYDEIRPGCPGQLIADVVRMSLIPAEGVILEVGCGTGQATLPFASRGYEILCVEMGPSMAAVAREKLRRFPKVEIVTSAFEEWEPQERRFDLIISASAFHWIAPQVGYPKAARLLNPGGSIAILSTVHPRPFSGFFERTQEIYRKAFPGTKEPHEWPTTDQVIEDGANEIRRSGEFEEPSIHRYSWSREYTRAEYLKLLSTFSDNLALEDGKRQRLFDGLGKIIDEEYGGKIVHPYLSVLHFAKKK